MPLSVCRPNHPARSRRNRESQVGRGLTLWAAVSGFVRSKSVTDTAVFSATTWQIGSSELVVRVRCKKVGHGGVAAFDSVRGWSNGLYASSRADVSEVEKSWKYRELTRKCIGLQRCRNDDRHAQRRVLRTRLRPAQHRRGHEAECRSSAGGSAAWRTQLVSGQVALQELDLKPVPYDQPSAHLADKGLIRGEKAARAESCVPIPAWSPAPSIRGRWRQRHH